MWQPIYLHADNVVFGKEVLQLRLIGRVEQFFGGLEVHHVVLLDDLEAGAGSAKVETPIKLAVKLGVVQVEGQRLC